MTPEQHQLVDELFDQALSLNTDQRQAFLAAAAIHDTSVRRELEALLLHHERAEEAGFLEKSFARSTHSQLRSCSDTTADLPVQPPDAVSGYEILGVLGQGGMGIVYKARQIRLNRVVALKMILDSQYASSKARQRFLAEAEMVARVRHPNIVQIHEANTHDTGPFFSMEFVEGGSLAARLQGKPFPVREAAELVRTLACAIEAAHQAGIIHRDLKPANVLLTTDGTPKIMDFGVARELTDSPGMTESGVILGTPSYMAPEQARGPSRAIGPACDIYALGAILYELLTGRPPFAAENSMETVLQVLSLEPVHPRQLQPKIPRDLGTICLKCLQKDPLQRYATAQELADDLNRFLHSEPIRARPVGPGEILWRYCQRNRIQAGLAAALIMTLVGGLIGMTWNLRAARENEARRKVELLLEAESDRVPQIVEGMSKYRPFIDSLLHNEFSKTTDGSKEKLNLTLALLTPTFESEHHENEKLSRYLFERLLDANVEDLRVIREILFPYRRFVLPKLWDTAKAPSAEPPTEPRRLRAVSALALFTSEDDLNWKEVKDTAAIDLLRVPKVRLYLWMELLLDVRNTLTPPLSAIFQDRKVSESERLLASEILAAFAEEDPKELAKLLLEADEKQFAVIFPKLRGSKRLEEQGLPELNRALMDTIPPNGIPLSDERRELLAKRQVNAAVALLRMNNPDEVWRLLKFEPHINPDPRVRSYLIHRLPQLGVDVATIMDRVAVEKDISVRRALILCLGEFKGLPADTVAKVLPLLQEIYRHDADPGLHAASEWLLRRWNQEDWLQEVNQQWANDRNGLTGLLEQIVQRMQKDETTPCQKWFVNSECQTFVAIAGPVAFDMGSPLTLANQHSFETPQHRVQISRTFAIAAKPVTVQNYNDFLAERYPSRAGEPPHTLEKMFPGEFTSLLLKNPEKPAVFISWGDAALYCNWLSKKENIPKDQWCYESNDLFDDSTVKPKSGYLSLNGYRLPTEAEVEFATRAGTSTSRYFGETDELLTNYAWFQKNSLEPQSDLEITQPVGRMKPNDFGLFDSLGNAWTWCQQKYRKSEDADQVMEDQEDEWGPVDRGTVGSGVIPHQQTEISLVLRGGSSREKSKRIRSSARTVYAPSARDASFGFRLARTVK